MAARAFGGVAAVVHTGTTTGTAYGAVAEVVWADRDLPAQRAEPLAFVLSQDQPLRSNVVSSATTELGPRVGIAYPAKTNEGDLLPFLSGSWDLTVGSSNPKPTPIALQLLSTGGLFDGAEWGWRYETDPTSQTRGAHDLRFQQMAHHPWSTAKTLGGHYALCYSSAFNRVVATRVRNGTASFDIAYRNLTGSDPSSGYTTTSYAPPVGKLPSYTGYSAIVELPDGSLRWFYGYVPDPAGAPSLSDIDMLTSSDGGATWRLVTERILTATFGATQQLFSLRAAASGDWIRLEIWNGSSSPQGICSAYSADRGATWGLSQSVGDGLDTTGGNVDATGRFEMNAVIGLGTLDGAFMRVRAITSTFGRWSYEFCSRDGAWSEGDFTVGMIPSYADAKAVYLARGGAYVFLLVHTDDGAGANEWGNYSYLIPLDRLQAGWSSAAPRVGEWVLWGDDILGSTGSLRYAPKGGTLAWLGDRLGFLSGGIDRETGVTTSEWKPGTLSYWSGYSQRPVHRSASVLTDEFGSMFTNYWSTQYGPPAFSGQSAYTPWGASSSGTPLATYNTDAWQITVGTPSTLSISVSQAAAGVTQFFADAGVAGWTTRANASTGSTQPLSVSGANFRSPRWGGSLQAMTSTGLSFVVGVCLSDDGRIGMYDAVALSTLYLSANNTLAGITMGTWYDVRVAMQRSGSTVKADLAWSKAGDSTWQSSGAVTLASGALPSAFQLFRWGHTITQASITSVYEWREAWWNRTATLGQFAPANPGDIRGWLCSTERQHIAQGISVRWGGGGGFEGDLFSAPVRSDYGAEQVLTASPDSEWRSIGTGAQQLLLDAQKSVPSNEVARFRHSGFSVVGTNSRYLTLEYGDDAGLSLPSRIYIDGRRYTARLESQTLASNSIRVSSSDSAQWRDGELAGHYCRAQVHALSTNPSTLRIASNHGDTLQFAGVTQILFNYGITSGVTIDIWADRHLLAFDDYPTGVRVIADPTSSGSRRADGDFPRYLRVSVPSATEQGAPPEGYWRIGGIVAGMTLPITVPMDWQANDRQEGNVDITTAGSGARSAYVAGSPRRTISGTSEGDVERWREAFRATVRHLGQYGAQVMVLCTDDQQQNLSMMYCRFISSTELSNAGWRYDTALSRWVQVGDLALDFVEEV